MPSHRGTCNRCQRELRGAVEINFMSLGRLVCISTIETPDCNWVRCRVCSKPVCKSCYFALDMICFDCFVKSQELPRSAATTRNGSGPDQPGPPSPLKKAA